MLLLRRSLRSLPVRALRRRLSSAAGGPPLTQSQAVERDAQGNPSTVAFPLNNYTYLVQPSAYEPDLEDEHRRTSQA